MTAFLFKRAAILMLCSYFPAAAASAGLGVTFEKKNSAPREKNEEEKAFEIAAKKLKTEYAKGFRDFVIEEHSMSGPRIGTIPEDESKLRVNGSGAATYFLRRGTGSAAEKPPGVYSGLIPESDIKGFLEILAGGGVRNIPLYAPGPREPIVFLNIIEKGQRNHLSWGFSMAPKPEAMVRMDSALEDWRARACRIAEWNISLDAENISFKSGVLSARLKIENKGRSGIFIAHPGSPGFGPQFGISLDYGERQLVEEGYTPEPIEFKTIPLAVKPISKPEFIEVKPGKPYLVDFRAELEGQAARGWIGRFSFLHYLPADTVQGRPVFNGAAVQTDLEW